MGTNVRRGQQRRQSLLALIEHLQGMPFGTLPREPKHGARLEKLLEPHQVFHRQDWAEPLEILARLAR
jgi:hypothetical protein